MILYVKIQGPESWWDDCSSTILGVFTKLGMEEDKLSYLNKAKEEIDNQIEIKEREIDFSRKENSSLQTAINHIEHLFAGSFELENEKQLKKERKRLIKKRDLNFFYIKDCKRDIEKLKSKTDEEIIEEYLNSTKIYYEEYPLNVSQ